MIEELINRCDKLLEVNHDEKYKLIKDILSNEKCFFEMTAETSINILIDLGYTEENAKKVYLKLTNKDNFLA